MCLPSILLREQYPDISGLSWRINYQSVSLIISGRKLGGTAEKLRPSVSYYYDTLRRSFLNIMPSIKLVKFNEKFLESIKDYKKIYLNPKKGIFYTITYGNKIAGVIGYIIKEGGKNILKIGIHQKYRGQDIFRNALDLLVKTHKIKKIYSTVLIANLASIKAHRKIGFRRIPKRIEEKLKTNGILLKRNTRMVKSFK